MSVTIANTTFERVVYDADSDVLYLKVPDSEAEAVTDATVEGHAIGRDAEGRITGITIVNAKWLLERDGEITLTERIPASSLAPALASN
ncbi:MAG TPA: DUF2283 domain-containing protein [Thermoleophilaceae bacterium]